MTFWLALAGMVAVTFGSRYAGLALRTELPAFCVRFLHFVPIAVFAALVRRRSMATSARARSASSARSRRWLSRGGRRAWASRSPPG